ncbi:hypothetical protein JCM18899A_04970 [Nocardioides sp. AN3]
MTDGSRCGWAPVPGVAPDGGAEGPATQLEVDGELFELTSDGFRGTHYAWISGPNAGYGFTSSPTSESPEEHRANIRNFLAMVDKETGYIED